MSTKHSEHTAFGQQCSNLMCDMNAILLTHNWLDAVQRHAKKNPIFFIAIFTRGLVLAQRAYEVGVCVVCPDRLVFRCWTRSDRRA